MNCWGIRKYFTKSRFSLNGGYIVSIKLLSGHEKIITKSGISLHAGILNRGFTVNKLSSITTDKAPATTGSKNGFIALCGNDESFPKCILH
jgi:hypothetical protein